MHVRTHAAAPPTTTTTRRLLDLIIFMGLFIAFAQLLLTESDFAEYAVARLAGAPALQQQQQQAGAGRASVCVPLTTTQLALLVCISCFTASYLIQEIRQVRRRPWPWRLLNHCP